MGMSGSKGQSILLQKEQRHLSKLQLLQYN